MNDSKVSLVFASKWSWPLLGFALLIISYLVGFIPLNQDALPDYAQAIKKAASILTFYLGLFFLIASVVYVCGNVLVSGLVSTNGNLTLGRINTKWNWAMTGLLLLFFQFCIEQFPIPKDVTDRETVTSIISSITTPMFYVGLAFLSASVVYTYIQEKVLLFWKQEVLTKIRENIDEVSTKYITAVRAESLEAVIGEADSPSAEKNLNLYVSKIYGEHCIKEKGFFNSVKGKLFKYLNTSTVHRSGYKKKITIDEIDKRHKWDEICEFRLHCLKLDSDYSNVTDGEEVDYEIRYNPSMGIDGAATDIQSFWNLEIRIFKDDSDIGEIIFDSKKALEFNEDKDGIVVKQDQVEGCNISADYNLELKEFSFRFSKKIKLNQAFTKVVITETSHLPENYFTLSAMEPSCGMDIDIHLPSGWEFEEHNIFNLDRAWSVTRHPSNRLSLSTTDWVLPGLIMNCIWKKCEEE